MKKTIKPKRSIHNPVFAVIEGKDKNTGKRWKDMTDIVENHEISSLLSNLFNWHIEFTSKIYDARFFDREKMKRELGI